MMKRGEPVGANSSVEVREPLLYVGFLLISSCAFLRSVRSDKYFTEYVFHKMSILILAMCITV